MNAAGKSPLIVMDDVDIAEAANIAHNACFENSGQCCWYVKFDIFLPIFCRSSFPSHV